MSQVKRTVGKVVWKCEGRGERPIGGGPRNDLGVKRDRLVKLEMREEEIVENQVNENRGPLC